MAKSISAEELQLRKRARRRLIGAIALVTIVAVFLPMALDHEPKLLNQDISIQIPSPGSGAFTSKIVPVPGAKPGAKPAPGTAARSEAAAKDDALSKAAEPAAKPVADVPTSPAVGTEGAPPKKPKPAAGQPKAQAKPAAKSAGGYVVQVIALNNADRAKQMQEEIAAAGVKSYTEVVPAKKGNVTRVRAGPFASRDEAERALAKLKGMGLNGNLVPK